MMSGHGANLIFFNKKNKDWTSRALANPHLPTSDNISFYLTPHPHSPPPSAWTFISVSPFNMLKLSLQRFFTPLRKIYFCCLLIYVRIKRHFPHISPSTYFNYIVVDVNIACTYVTNFRE